MDSEDKSPKQIKDSVHGYIEIESEFIIPIDTSAFQRLKRLQQTSYRALYPSASHDRFIHSIGVFHLGKMVFNAIKENTGDIVVGFEEVLAKWRKPFLVACLLHDIGHAPFSHTCEDFFSPELIDELTEALRHKTSKKIADDFISDYEQKPSANSHEIMSALVLLNCDELRLSEWFNFLPEDYDLAIRAIVGCPYSLFEESQKDENDIKNSLVRLLNSSIIDVDKLDYIVRDAVLSGYKNVEMDLPRLTSSFVLFRNKEYNESIWPMYRNSAQSVIENVFTARNTSISGLRLTISLNMMPP